MVAMDTFSNSINSMPSADTLKPNQTKRKKKFTTQDYSHYQSYRGKGEDRNRTEPALEPAEEPTQGQTDSDTDSDLGDSGSGADRDPDRSAIQRTRSEADPDTGSGTGL